MLRDITTRLDDHDPGEKLLHEASAEIKALRSKLDARTKEVGELHAELHDALSRIDALSRVANIEQCEGLIEQCRNGKLIAGLQSRLDAAERAREEASKHLAALERDAFARSHAMEQLESRLDSVRGWLDSYGEDVGGVRTDELRRILDGAVERQSTCDHPAHNNPGLIVPCPQCEIGAQK